MVRNFAGLVFCLYHEKKLVESICLNNKNSTYQGYYINSGDRLDLSYIIKCQSNKIEEDIIFPIDI